MIFFKKTKNLRIIILVMLVLLSFSVLSGCGTTPTARITITATLDGEMDVAGVSGVVKINASENVDGLESEEFEKNEIILLSASSNQGYRFDGWYSSSPANLLSEEHSFDYTVTGSGEIKIYAYFETKPQYEATLYAYTKSLSMEVAELSNIGGTVKLGLASENTTHTDIGTYNLWGSVSVIAVPDDNYDFLGWFLSNNFESSNLSNEESYPILIVNNTILYAYFEEKPIPTHTITAYSFTNLQNDSSGGLVTAWEGNEEFAEIDGYVYEEGETAEISATVNEGYVFVGWFRDLSFEIYVTSAITHSFIVTSEEDFYASFIEIGGPIPIGIGTEDYPYEMANYQHLQWIENKTNEGQAWSTDKYIIQTDDINLLGLVWEPIGIDETYSFKGNYDGQGYKIENLQISETYQNYIGLFGYTDGAFLENIVLYNSRILAYEDTDDIYVGMLTGYSVDSEISQVAIHSVSQNSTLAIYGANDTEGNMYIGGIVGHGEDIILTKSYSNLRIYVYERADNTEDNDICIGGLVGELSGTNTTTAIIEDCFNTSVHIKEYSAFGSGANITYMGGIVGRVSAVTINRCYTAEKTDSYTLFVQDDGTGVGSYITTIGNLVGYSAGSIHSNNYYNNEFISGTNGVGDASNDISNSNVGIINSNFTNEAFVPNLFSSGDNWVMDTQTQINGYPVIYGVNNTYEEPQE
jgi:hypothetical protein